MKISFLKMSRATLRDNIKTLIPPRLRGPVGRAWRILTHPRQMVREIFSGRKIIESKTLNFFGLQVQRIIAARLIYNFRSVSGEEDVKDEVGEIIREGILMLPNFLPPDHFESVRRECLLLLDEDPDKARILVHGPNTLEWAEFKHFEEDILPNTSKAFADPRLHAILEGVEKRPLPLDFLSETGKVERMTQGSFDDEEDPQTQLHTDTFFNNHKLWLYLSDVEMEDGPLTFVRRSHRLSLPQLYYVYKDSWQRDPSSDRSRRITPDERNRRGLQETIVTCPKNTLVIINACGYHRRLLGQPGRKRHSVHLSLHADPFTRRKA